MTQQASQSAKGTENLAYTRSPQDDDEDDGNLKHVNESTSISASWNTKSSRNCVLVNVKRLDTPVEAVENVYVSHPDTTRGVTYPKCHSLNTEEGGNLANPQEPSKTNEAALWPQLQATLTMCLSGLLVGFVIGFSSPTIPELEAKGVLDPSLSGWYASLASLGTVFGSVMGGPSTDRFGRKTTIMLACVPNAVGWFVITAFADDAVALLFGRFITGLSAGIHGATGPLYVSEIAMPEIRGLLGGVLIMFGSVGVFFTFLFGIFLSTSWLAVIGLVVTLAFVLLALLLPSDTPRWLYSMDRIEEAKVALRWFRGPDYDMTQETADILESIKESKQTVPFKLAELKQPEIHKPFLIALMVMLVNCATGINTVSSFLETTLIAGGMGDFAGTYSTIVAFVAIGALVLACILPDKFGRRPIMIWSGLGTALFGFPAGLYYLLADKGILNAEKDWWILAVLFGGAAFAFQAGICVVTWIIAAEVLPMRGKGVMAAAISAFSSFMSFIYLTLYIGTTELIGYYGLFWVYSVSAVLCSVWVYFYVPETAGKTLEDIPEFFKTVKNENTNLVEMGKTERSYSDLNGNTIETMDL